MLYAVVTIDIKYVSCRVSALLMALPWGIDIWQVEISVRCQLRSAALPTAHTCFFQLDVPDYDKEAVLRHKLLQAVNNTASFDVV